MTGPLIGCGIALLLVAATGLALPALERWLRGPGHHKRPARLLPSRAPARPEAPAQGPRPGDHPLGRAARSGPGQPVTPAPGAAPGQARDAGDAPSPAADATTTPDGGVAQLPRPELVPPWAGPGQPQRPAWVIFPDDRAALTERGTVRLQELGWEGHARETGGMPALVRPAARRRFEHVDDAVVTL